jgi:hypothetical protein
VSRYLLVVDKVSKVACSKKFNFKYYVKEITNILVELG